MTLERVLFFSRILSGAALSFLLSHSPLCAQTPPPQNSSVHTYTKGDTSAENVAKRTRLRQLMKQASSAETFEFLVQTTTYPLTQADKVVYRTLDTTPATIDYIFMAFNLDGGKTITRIYNQAGQNLPKLRLTETTEISDGSSNSIGVVLKKVNGQIVEETDRMGFTEQKEAVKNMQQRLKDKSHDGPAAYADWLKEPRPPVTGPDGSAPSAQYRGIKLAKSAASKEGQDYYLQGTKVLTAKDDKIAGYSSGEFVLIHDGNPPLDDGNDETRAKKWKLCRKDGSACYGHNYADLDLILRNQTGEPLNIVTIDRNGKKVPRVDLARALRDFEVDDPGTRKTKTIKGFRLWGSKNGSGQTSYTFLDLDAKEYSNRTSDGKMKTTGLAASPPPSPANKSTQKPKESKDPPSVVQSVKDYLRSFWEKKENPANFVAHQDKPHSDPLPVLSSAELQRYKKLLDSENPEDRVLAIRNLSNYVLQKLIGNASSLQPNDRIVTFERLKRIRKEDISPRIDSLLRTTLDDVEKQRV